MKERIYIFRPFAYIDLWGYEIKEMSIENNGKTFECRQLFWRFYWIGLL